MTKVTQVWTRMVRLWLLALLIAVPSVLFGCGSDSTDPVATGGSGGSGGTTTGDAKPDTIPAETGDTLKKAAMPTFSVAGGKYQSDQNIQINTTTAGAKIYYTLDGNTPTATSTLYSTAIKLVVPSTTTIKAIAVAATFTDSDVASATYILEEGTKKQCVPPTFNPQGGTYTSVQNVAITSSSSTCDIYYTVDGNDPNQGSQKYASPVAVSTTTTLKAIAIDGSQTLLPSAISAATYTFPSKAATPVFSLPAGTYTGDQTVQITTATANAQLFYTVDGTDPTTASTQYTMPISLTATTTLKALAVATGFQNSDIATALYTIGAIDPEANPPTFAPPGGTYPVAQTVTISSTTPAAEIRYTMDGSDPTLTSPVYTAPLDIASNAIVKAFVSKAVGFSPSNISTAIYTITPVATQCTVPTITPNGGTFTTPQQVTLASTEPGAVILYTVNGTLPTISNGIVYSGPFTVNGPTTVVNAVTTATTCTNSNPVSATFIINIPIDVVLPVTITPGTTTSTNDIDVALTTGTAGATICYTTDGSAPTCAGSGACQTGQTYGGVPVTINKTATVLNAIACKASMTPSNATNATYTLNTADVQFSPAPGLLAYGSTITMTTATVGATVRFRTDGVDPTCTTGTVFAGGVVVTQNTEFRAVACKANYGPTPLVAQSGTYQVQLLPLIATIPSGTVNNAQNNVRFNVIYPTGFTLPGTASICYTVDGAAPTCAVNGACGAGTLSTAGPVADPFLGSVFGPIPVLDAPVGGNSIRNVRAINCAPNYVGSPVTTATYTFKVATPAFSRVAGTTTLVNENAANVITTTTLAPNTRVRYYNIVAGGPAPALDCGAAAIVGVTDVAASTTPNIPTNGGRTLGAIACKTDYLAADVATANYPLPGQTVAPVFTLSGNPIPATLNNDLASNSVKMSTTSIPTVGEAGATGIVCWTLADVGNIDCNESATAPTCVFPAFGQSGLYTWNATTSVSNVPPVPISSNGKQLRAIACGNGLSKSSVTTQVLKFAVATPVITAPAPGDTIGIGEQLLFTSITTGTTFRYTVGTVAAPPADPNCTSVGTVGTSYTVTNGDRLNGSLIVKVIGCRVGYDPSAVTTSTTYLNFRGGSAVFSIKAGTYGDILDTNSSNLIPGPTVVTAGGAGVNPTRICVTVDGFAPACTVGVTPTCTGGATHYVGGANGVQSGDPIPWTAIDAANNFTLRALPCYSSTLNLAAPPTTVEGPYNFVIAPLKITNTTPAPNPSPFAKTQRLELRVGNEAAAGPPVVDAVRAPWTTLTGPLPARLCYTYDGTPLSATCVTNTTQTCIDMVMGTDSRYINLYLDSTRTITAKACKSIMTSSADARPVDITPFHHVTKWDGSDEFVGLEATEAFQCTTNGCNYNMFRVSWDDGYLMLSGQGCHLASETANVGNYLHAYIGSPTLNGTNFQQAAGPNVAAGPAQMSVFPNAANVNTAVPAGARWHVLYNVETHAVELRQYNFSNGNWNDLVPAAGVQALWGAGNGTWNTCAAWGQTGNYGDFVIVRIPWSSLGNIRYFNTAFALWDASPTNPLGVPGPTNLFAWPSSNTMGSPFATTNTMYYFDRMSWRTPRGSHGTTPADPLCWRDGVDSTPTCQFPEDDSKFNPTGYDTAPRLPPINPAWPTFVGHPVLP